MTVNVKLFATFRELAGSGNLKAELREHATVTDLIEQLETEYPGFHGRLRQLALVAINEKYSHRYRELAPDDLVALFPPVSGG